ncbi:MAG: hypothetical protein AB8B64_18775 [Granulosicoccus sp.]
MINVNSSIPLSAHERETIRAEPGRDNGLDKKVYREEICLALDSATLDEIRVFRKREYRHVYPMMDLDNDLLDKQALILYSRNASGVIDSTARLTFDGPHSLPEEQYLGSYREKGFRVMEMGRFIKKRAGLKLLKNYYRAFYLIAQRAGCDVIVMAMQREHIRFHQNKMGLEIIKLETGEYYGGKHNLACVAWRIKNTKAEFLQWIAS